MVGFLASRIAVSRNALLLLQRSIRRTICAIVTDFQSATENSETLRKLAKLFTDEKFAGRYNPIGKFQPGELLRLFNFHSTYFVLPFYEPWNSSRDAPKERKYRYPFPGEFEPDGVKPCYV